MNSIKQGGYIAEKADKIYEVGVICFFYYCNKSEIWEKKYLLRSHLCQLLRYM